MSSKGKYTGTLNVGTSVLTSRAEVKLENNGKAFLEFKQGEPGKGKVGITDLMVLDNKVKVAGWYSASDKKGQVDLEGDVAKDVTLTVSPPLPLPQNLQTVPCRLTVKKKLSMADAKLTLHSKEKKGVLELTKKFDHEYLAKGTVTIDSASRQGTVKLESTKQTIMDLTNVLELNVVSNIENPNAAKGSLLLKTEVNKDFNLKTQVDYPPVKNHQAKLMAVYKMGEVNATASCFVDGPGQFSEPNLELKSTFEF